MNPLPAWAWTLIVIALITAVLYFGVRISVRSQLVLALISIVVVTIFFIVVIAKLGSANSFKPFNPSSSADGWGGIFFGVLYGVLLARRGAIVAVASVAALRASSGMGGYAVTKAGLTMLTQSLAVDHAHQGLRANVVCPGWTVTEMADEEMTAFGATRGLAVRQAYELVTSLVPQRRAAGVDEVAAVVTWLLSDAASYVNGAVIPVDGSATAVDVGTVPFDPRIEIRPV